MKTPKGDEVTPKKYRKRIRERYILPIQVDAFEQNTNAYLGNLYDINDMGIRLTSETPIPVNRFIKIRLQLPEKISDREFISFDTFSIWNRQDPSSMLCSTGFLMLNISQENNQTLHHLIHRYTT